MPVQAHSNRSFSCVESDNDVAWMSVVLSPPAADVPLLPAASSSLDDTSALELEPELPASSFRLQFLRAWIAARGGRPAEVAGHA